MQIFLAAHLQQRLDGRRVTVSTGIYGDVAGTLAQLKDAGRAGRGASPGMGGPGPAVRLPGGGPWGVSALPGILSDAIAMLDRMAAAVEEIRPEIPIAVCLPTLPLPPIFHTAGWQAAEAQLALEQKLAEFASRMARRCSLVSSARLAEDSPAAGRYDLKVGSADRLAVHAVRTRRR